MFVLLNMLHRDTKFLITDGGPKLQPLLWYLGLTEMGLVLSTGDAINKLHPKNSCIINLTAYISSYKIGCRFILTACWSTHLTYMHSSE
jgi:hypothetical protein